MIDCRRTAEHLASYVDETLARAERVEVDQHLDACPPCRLAAAAERGARTVLRNCARSLRSEALPPGFRTRCEALARANRRPVQAPWRTRFVPSLVIALLLIFTMSALFPLATRRSETLLAAQLTLDHAKCFKLFPSASDAGADAPKIEAMLADKYGWDVHVPPSSAANGITLIGARRCLYGEGSVPHVMYEVNGHDVSLYVLGGIMRDRADLVTMGHRSRIWSRDGTTYVLVSSTSAGEIGAAARYVMQEAH